ncbi:MAG TPA: enoyl-CoA hydratase/isomerase family protein [Burkholderiaceae bacterium]|nr:enoyl-CoA hydratase/isomerase family protein [Burkholderiaceae bacterium]
MSEQTALHIERADAVATVWLARPQVRNAFNDVMVAELTACFEQLATDAHVRVIILAARGPAFCAGADLAWMQRMSRFSEAENLADARALARMLHTLYTCPKPVIARVHGDAYAGGLGLVAASDVAVAADAARFCLSEVKLGLIAATIAPYVVRAMGERQARRYVLSAEVFDASAAQRIGLVHSAVAPEALDAEVSRIAQAFLAASPAAIASAKSLLREIAQRPIDEALIELTATRIAQARASADGQEGIAAFLEKRQPGWV